MKIGIDCRLFGPKHTGIGRYVQNLVENLLILDKENEYVLFVNKDSTDVINDFKLKIENCLKIVEADISHYSLKEQLFFSKIIKREKVDLMHFPHFNVPVFYKGKYIVTIHDLIKHNSRGSETTTRSKWIYWLKYIGYKFVFKQTVERAERIITPSNFVKNELIEQYGLKAGKIAVTYEGTDNKFKVQGSKFKVAVQSSKLLEKYKITKPYLLYVGSVYPHKNIEKLIEVVSFLNAQRIISHLSFITLVIVCARNVFIERLNKYIEQSNAGEFVKLTGFVPDDELAFLYQEAEAFVFPTLSEGFGLPGLEAMSAGCPVVCSDIPVLREIYKDNALYFNPLDAKDIAEKIKQVVSDKKLKETLKEHGYELAKCYSWEKMARQTLKTYQEVLFSLS